MNLSILYRHFELAGAWPRAAQPTARTSKPASGLTDMQRRLVFLHVAQATPTMPSDARARWPGVTIFCSLMAVLFIVAAGGWQ